MTFPSPLSPGKSTDFWKEWGGQVHADQHYRERIFADSGEVLIDGQNARENMKVHEKIFCMSEADLYAPELKVRDHFKWISRFYDSFDMKKALEIGERFQLNVNKKFKGLSKGYQSIFKLTVALSLQVPYVIFDEPVLGLDANHRELFYQLLLEDFENGERTSSLPPI